MRVRRTFLVAAAATAVAGWMPAAWPQDYPSKPVRWIAPVPPGSPPDAVARKIAEGAAQRLKVPVIIENKPGVGGSIGATEAARSAPDGYTFLFAISDALVSTPAIVKAPYDPQRDFTLISKLAVNGPLLVIHPSHRLETLRELVDAAKASKADLSYASFGPGSFPQLVMEPFGRQAGVRFREIPYKGSPQAMQDLLGNQIALGFTSPNLAAPLIAAGKIRPLAIVGTARSPLLPNVPTFAEAGFDSFFARNAIWIGLVGPARLPASVAGRMGEAVRATLRDPALAKWLTETGWDVVAGTAAEFEKDLQVEVQTVTRFIRVDLGIQPQ